MSEHPPAQEALRRAEEQFRLTIEQAPIGIALVSTGGSFLVVNRALCAITGYDQDELLKLTFQDITHPGDLAADLSLLDQLLAGSIPRFSLAKRYVHKGGHTVDVMLHVSLVRDEQGRPIHLVSQVEDVTERRHVQARLAQAERLASLGALASGVAHEVNNPLACIMSGLQVLREALARPSPGAVPAPAPADVEGIIDDAQRAAERIHKIVRALRTFARGEGTSPAVLDLHDVLDTTASLLSAEVEGRARVVRDYGAVPRVRADEARLAQLFMNLIVNAAHSIPPGAPEANEIRIVTGTDADGRAVVQIQDTGGGIPASDVNRLFEPFFTTKPFGKGSGLGLAVAHGIVTALGGEITAENRPRGGATLKVILPGAGP